MKSLYPLYCKGYRLIFSVLGEKVKIKASSAQGPKTKILCDFISFLQLTVTCKTCKMFIVIKNAVYSANKYWAA